MFRLNRNIWVIPFVLVLIIGIHYYLQTIKAAPEFAEAETVVKSNPAVKSRFGTVISLEMDSVGDEFGYEWGSKGRITTGSYQFNVKGSSRNGIVRIYWRSSRQGFEATKIEEVTEGFAEGLQPIWQSN